jgi:hypothetical protein
MPSTAIRDIEYRRSSRELLVTFTTGRKYIYWNVPAETYWDFRNAESRGRYFNLNIRDRYPFRELHTSPQ